MPLPPEARFEVAGPVAAAAAAAVPEAGPVGLEDFLGSSHASSNQDNVSLLDLSMAANQVGSVRYQTYQMDVDGRNCST